MFVTPTLLWSEEAYERLNAKTKEDDDGNSIRYFLAYRARCNLRLVCEYRTGSTSNLTRFFSGGGFTFFFRENMFKQQVETVSSCGGSP